MNEPTILGSQEQYLVEDFSIGPTIQAIDEGGLAALNLHVLCVDGALGPADSVTVAIDWGDGTVPDTVVLDDPGRWRPDGGEGLCTEPSHLVVCNEAMWMGFDPRCHAIPHRYADNGPFQVTAISTHGSGQATALASVDVRNVAPALTSLVRRGGAVEGLPGEFVARAYDPGVAPGEIARVTWTWTPADQTLDPTVIDCHCTASPHCDDGTDQAMCTGPATAEGFGETRWNTYLDDGVYTATVAIYDKDGASDARSVSTTIFNAVPANLTVSADALGLFSTNPETPTLVTEGTEYQLRGGFLEQGIDEVLIDWRYGDGLTFSGTANVSKATYPAIDARAPADILDPAKFWDDDGDADPLPVDRTLTFEVTDDDAGQNRVDRYLQVQDVEPVISAFTVAGVAGNIGVLEGTPVLFQVTAVSGAENPQADPLDPQGYAWMVNQGPPAIPGEVAVVEGCTNADDICRLEFLDADTTALYHVDVRVTDEDSGVSTRELEMTRSVSVHNAPPVIASAALSTDSIGEGDAVSATVVFEDRAGALDGPFTVTVGWGDVLGSATEVASAAPASVHIPAFTFADNKRCDGGAPVGLCQITYTVCELGGTVCAEATGLLTVLNLAPVPAIAYPSAGIVLDEGVHFDLDGVFTDRAGSLDDPYDWAWSWSDGIYDRGAVGMGALYLDRATALDASGAGLFTEVGSAGRFDVPIELAVTDGDRETGTTTVLVNLRDNAPAVTIDALRLDNGGIEPAVPTLELNVAAQTEADLLTRVMVAWGDGSSEVFTQDDGGVAIAGGGGTFLLTKAGPYVDNGVYPVTVTLYDEDSFTEAGTSATVLNAAPTIVEMQPAAPGPLVVAEGQAANFRITATDPSSADRPSLLFHFDWKDGTETVVRGSESGTDVIGLASHVFADPGSFAVSIWVTDKDGGASERETVVVDVTNRAPAITDTFDTGPIPEGGLVTAVTLVDNPGSDTLTYTWNFECAAPSAAQIRDADFAEPRPGDGGRPVASWSYAEDGTYNVCVRVCDDDGLPNSCAFGHTAVRVDNVAPEITSFPTPAPVFESATGASVTLTALAVDAGEANDPLTYGFDCDDDGVLEASGSTGVHTCTYAESGSHFARLVVTDDEGASDEGFVVVTVTNLPPQITTAAAPDVDEGTMASFVVEATDPGGDALTYSWDFDADGVYDAVGPEANASYGYVEDGAKAFRVRTCDTDAACATADGTLLVRNLAPTIDGVSLPSAVTVGSAATIVVSASDPGADALGYRFRFYDASGTLVQTVGPQSGHSATVTFSTSGLYDVEITVTDTARAPNSVLSAVTTRTYAVTDLGVPVTAVASPATIDEGGDTRITVTAKGTGPYLVSYDINGDGDFDDPMDVLPAGPSDACTVCTAEVTYAQNGPGELPYRVLVRVVDTGAGNTIANAIVSVTVRNVAPILAAVPAQRVEEQATLTLQLVGTDAGVLDTLTYALVSAPAGAMLDGATGLFTWMPTWHDEGLHSVQARVGDGDGAFAAQAFGITVAIIDTNGNGVSDTRERELNDGELLPPNAGEIDSDLDGVSDLDEVLAGTNPEVSDAPLAPVIISPDGEMVTTLEPELLVANALSPRALPMTYTFVVLESDEATEVGRVEGVLEGASTTQATFDTATLMEDTEYAWYAFAHDGLVAGAHSEIAWMRVNAENAAPPAPMALTPLDGARFAPGAMPTLEVRAVHDPDGDTVSYRFEVALDESFASETMVLTSELRTIPVFTLPEALHDAVYYWRAWASDGTLESASGFVWHFEVDIGVLNEAPGMPGIVRPHDQNVATTTVDLVIEAAVDPDGDALMYEMELAEDGTFVDAMTSGLTTELIWRVRDLVENTSYYWRARAYDGYLTSEWALATFRVDTENEPPYGLAILSPADGALLATGPETFVVESAMDPDGDVLIYRFAMGLDRTFTTTLREGEVAAGVGTTEWTPESFSYEKNETYYWRARVSDGAQTIEATGSFVVSPVGCGCDAGATGAGASVLLLLGTLWWLAPRRRP